MSVKPVNPSFVAPGERQTHPMLILAICCFSLFLVTMDTTIVNVALPAIHRDLQASIAGLQWAIDGYTLVIASFLMLAGSTADRVGRRRTFQAGLGLFACGSLLCSFAPSPPLLIASRMVQALGGAMLNPVAMSIVTNTFIDPRERARAIGIWGSVVGISMAMGPLLGGFLTQTLGWRSIFWVNVPICVVAIGLTARFVPESRAPQGRRVDPVGQLLVVVTLASWISGLIEQPRLGWGAPFIVGLLGLGVASFVALLVYEQRRTEPLIDLRFFGSLPFSTATAMAVMAFIAFSGFLFLNSLYLQEARGLSASAAGLCLLPVAVAVVICSPLSGRLVAAGNARIATVVAGAGMALGAALLTDMTIETPMVRLLAGYTLFGMGLGMVNAPITNAAVSGMPRSQAGLAAALASTSRQVGAALGVAIAGSIVRGREGPALGADFVASTHGFWWVVVGCGSAVVALGLVATGPAAHESVRKVAHLLEPSQGA